MRPFLFTVAVLAAVLPVPALAVAEPPAPDLYATLIVERSVADRSVLRFLAIADNVGTAGSGPFQLRVELAGEVVIDARAADLAQGQRLLVAASRPVGEEGLATLAVDALGEVAELDESNNADDFLVAYHDVAITLRLEPVEGKLLSQRAVVTACHLGGAATQEQIGATLVLRSNLGTSRHVGYAAFPVLVAGDCVERTLLLGNPGVGAYFAEARLWSYWDLEGENDLAEARGHSVTDPGFGVVTVGEDV